MVSNQFIVILPWLLHPQHKHNGLLGPVCSLEKVVELEVCLMVLVWEQLIHRPRVEVPQWCPAHDKQSTGAEDSEIDGSIHLFHEAGLLCPALQPAIFGHRSQKRLHNEFSGEGEDNHVESHKSKIPGTLPILSRRTRRVVWIGWQRV